MITVSKGMVFSYVGEKPQEMINLQIPRQGWSGTDSHFSVYYSNEEIKELIKDLSRIVSDESESLIFG